MKGCLKISTPTSTPLHSPGPSSRSSPTIPSGSVTDGFPFHQYRPNSQPISRTSSSGSVGSEADGHCTLRKCVAFGIGTEVTETIYPADEWDRTPTEPAKQLSYQDILELKAIQNSLPRANQPPDIFSASNRAKQRHLLSGVPIGLLPLLPEDEGCNNVDSDLDVDKGDRNGYGRYGFGYGGSSESSSESSSGACSPRGSSPVSGTTTTSTATSDTTPTQARLKLPLLPLAAPTPRHAFSTPYSAPVPSPNPGPADRQQAWTTINFQAPNKSPSASGSSSPLFPGHSPSPVPSSPSNPTPNSNPNSSNSTGGRRYGYAGPTPLSASSASSYTPANVPPPNPTPFQSPWTPKHLAHLAPRAPPGGPKKKAFPFLKLMEDPPPTTSTNDNPTSNPSPNSERNTGIPRGGMRTPSPPKRTASVTPPGSATHSGFNTDVETDTTDTDAEDDMGPPTPSLTNVSLDSEECECVGGRKEGGGCCELDRDRETERGAGSYFPRGRLGVVYEEGEEMLLGLGHGRGPVLSVSVSGCGFVEGGGGGGKEEKGGVTSSHLPLPLPLVLGGVAAPAWEKVKEQQDLMKNAAEVKEPMAVKKEKKPRNFIVVNDITIYLDDDESDDDKSDEEPEVPREEKEFEIPSTQLALPTTPPLSFLKKSSTTPVKAKAPSIPSGRGYTNPNPNPNPKGNGNATTNVLSIQSLAEWSEDAGEREARLMSSGMVGWS